MGRRDMDRFLAEQHLADVFGALKILILEILCEYVPFQNYLSALDDAVSVTLPVQSAVSARLLLNQIYDDICLEMTRNNQ